jgi:phosphoribosylglycinamide formyltransferase-1
VTGGAEGEARKLRLGVLFSGGGRTLENLVTRSRDGTVPAEVVLAVSSHAEATGVERALRLGVPCRVVDHREWGERLSGEVTRLLDEARVDLVALGGFIRRYEFPERYRGRVLNIHPALLPAFGGKGFYGDRVHRAALESGAKFSGCTVHFATGEYDDGPIILQRLVPVSPCDTPESLAARVFEEECAAYPEAIRLYAEGRLEVSGGRVTVLPPKGYSSSPMNSSPMNPW